MICEEKDRLRHAVRKASAEIADAQRELLSREIIARVEQLPKFVRSHTVALYAALPDEVIAAGLLRRWAGVKRLLLPAIESGEMVFREYASEDDLTEGAFGILQPGKGSVVPASAIGAMLVPGIAFDARGHRLGRGKGFYDRYLAAPGAAGIYKIGICLPHQFVGEIPCEPHDIVMDEVVTVF